jgi:hypothetical protein
MGLYLDEIRRIIKKIKERRKKNGIFENYENAIKKKSELEARENRKSETKIENAREILRGLSRIKRKKF